ncbi:pilin major subunit VirB2 [Bradyrhizobium sp. CCGUVB23]|uniref:pilin major subunit VirB2 n=1 Tax=Bradyrhizobium sp. CCGUVB23 TaxID=2949630 RepID=UPI003531F2B7
MSYYESAGAYWTRLSVRKAVRCAYAVGAAIGGTVLSVTPAAADGADPAAMLNNICKFILGPFGQSLAVLGIVAIGVSWMFGRASLGLVAGVVGGVVIMFGASFLAQALIGSG